MNRFHARALGASAFALLSAAAANAQVCYEQENQCFSFAPWRDEVDLYGDGIDDGFDRLEVGGDFRLRVRMADTPSDEPYNENDQQATRFRLHARFDVNEKTYVFAEYVYSETWAGSKPYSDARPTDPFNGLGQVYVHADDLFGFDDTWRVGRSTYVLGNGLILGSCDFLQYPSTFTGVWASESFGEHELELFAFDDYGQLNLNPGTRYVGATGRVHIGDEGAGLETIDPYFMAGTGDGDMPSDDTWYGVEVDGTAPAELEWRFHWAHRDVDMGDDVSAYRASLARDFTGVVDRVSLTRTDSDGAMHVNPADFNTAGLLHEYGGAWRSDLETNQLRCELAPYKDLDLDFNLLTFDGDNATQGETELDVMVGKPLAQGLYGWIGYGRDDEDRQVGYLQLTVFF